MGIKLSELVVVTPNDDRRFCALFHPRSERWVEIYRGERFIIHRSYLDECINAGMHLVDDSVSLCYATPEEAEANARKHSYNKVS